MKIALAMLGMMTAGCSVLFAPDHYDDDSGEIRGEEPPANAVAKKPSAAKVDVASEDAGVDAMPSATPDAGAAPPVDAEASTCADGLVECRTHLTKELRCQPPEHTCLVHGEVICSLL